MAEILSRGLGVPLNAAEAAKWYALAAEQGVPESQFQYALMLLDGRYVKKDDKEAYALMQAAAEAGNRLAQFNFAQLLVQQDPGDAGLAKAVPYYERAAATGLADAQYAMSQVYANGVGGKPRDDAQARRLLAQAARQNYDTAQIDLAAWMIEGRGGARDLKSGFRLDEAGRRGRQCRRPEPPRQTLYARHRHRPRSGPRRRLVHRRPPRRPHRSRDGRFPAGAERRPDQAGPAEGEPPALIGLIRSLHVV